MANVAPASALPFSFTLFILNVSIRPPIVAAEYLYFTSVSVEDFFPTSPFRLASLLTWYVVPSVLPTEDKVALYVTTRCFSSGIVRTILVLPSSVVEKLLPNVISSFVSVSFTLMLVVSKIKSASNKSSNVNVSSLSRRSLPCQFIWIVYSTILSLPSTCFPVFESSLLVISTFPVVVFLPTVALFSNVILSPSTVTPSPDASGIDTIFVL